MNILPYYFYLLLSFHNLRSSRSCDLLFLYLGEQEKKNKSM